MDNIQMQGIDSRLGQVVLKDIDYLKQTLDSTLSSSDQQAIKDLIEETEFSLEQVKGDSKTYHEKYSIFNRLNDSWFDAWNHYGDYPETVDLLKLLNHLTDYSIAYTYLFLSLSLINEGRVGEYKTDLERIVSGFLLLSEIVDVFAGFFSASELEKIFFSAQNALSVSARDLKEYFEDMALSNLVTQLRAYSSLIILKIEERLNRLEEKSPTTVEPGFLPTAFAHSVAASESLQLRPFGLASGEFIVPDSFNDPLPEDILSAFEGR